jgi:hypothetical protein
MQEQHWENNQEEDRDLRPDAILLPPLFFFIIGFTVKNCD